MLPKIGFVVRAGFIGSSSGYAGVIGVVAAHLGGFSALGTLSPLTASAQDSINLQRLLNQHLGICIVCCQKGGGGVGAGRVDGSSSEESARL